MAAKAPRQDKTRGTATVKHWLCFGPVTDIHTHESIIMTLSSDVLSSLNFGPVTDIYTEYDAYEGTMHMHSWAQKSEGIR